jgi:hypothetical protein
MIQDIDAFYGGNGIKDFFDHLRTASLGVIGNTFNDSFRHKHLLFTKFSSSGGNYTEAIPGCNIIWSVGSGGTDEGDGHRWLFFWTRIKNLGLTQFAD